MVTPESAVTDPVADLREMLRQGTWVDTTVAFPLDAALGIPEYVEIPEEMVRLSTALTLAKAPVLPPFRGLAVLARVLALAVVCAPAAVAQCSQGGAERDSCEDTCPTRYWTG